MKNTTRSLARFASGLGFDSLDQDLVVRFKIGLLDAVGCAVHGSAQPWARMVNRFIKEQRGKREATLWLQRFRGPSANVALGLGVMIHSFDFDDYHNAKIHPGAPVIPAAVAVGESIGASGKAVITAATADGSAERRTEVALISEYRACIEQLLQTLSAEKLPLAAQIARIPEEIRGFGHVKERHLKAARAKWDALMADWRSGTQRKAA